jgi:hypothetical protein
MFSNWSKNCFFKVVAESVQETPFPKVRLEANIEKYLSSIQTIGVLSVPLTFRNRHRVYLVQFFEPNSLTKFWNLNQMSLTVE